MYSPPTNRPYLFFFFFPPKKIPSSASSFSSTPPTPKSKSSLHLTTSYPYLRRAGSATAAAAGQPANRPLTAGDPSRSAPRPSSSSSSSFPSPPSSLILSKKKKKEEEVSRKRRKRKKRMKNWKSRNWKEERANPKSPNPPRPSPSSQIQSFPRTAVPYYANSTSMEEQSTSPDLGLLHQNGNGNAVVWYKEPNEKEQICEGETIKLERCDKQTNKEYESSNEEDKSSEDGKLQGKDPPMGQIEELTEDDLSEGSLSFFSSESEMKPSTGQFFFNPLLTRKEVCKPHCKYMDDSSFGGKT